MSKQRTNWTANFRNAYEKIGSEAIKAVNYYKNEIDRLLREENKESIKSKMFSKRVRDAIQNKFPQETEYKKEDLLNGISDVFKSNGINAKVNLNTIKKY